MPGCAPEILPALFQPPERGAERELTARHVDGNTILTGTCCLHSAPPFIKHIVNLVNSMAFFQTALFGAVNADEMWCDSGWQSHPARLQQHVMHREEQGIHSGHVE